MVIGIPKEIMHGEGRVSAIPETVAKFRRDGYEVLVEKGAGLKAFFKDDDYISAGAQIIDDISELYKKSDIILKVKEPQYNTQLEVHEIEMMHKDQYLITFIHPASPANHEMVKSMAKKGIIGLTLDGVQTVLVKSQSMDALTSMSTCAGYKGILIAANDLAKFMPQIFCAAGMIKPCNVLVIGTGVAGLQALITAKRMGAVTYAADIRPDATEQATSVGAKIIDTGIPREVAIGKGGYASALSEDWLSKEREVLRNVLPEMDIVFCSALIPSKLAPVLITEDMVKSMKGGSVIVDISIDQGGNCAITEAGETTAIHGITIEGIKNIPGMIPTSSTWMFAHNIYNLLKYLTKDNAISLDQSDEIVQGILTTINGEIVHKGALEAMGDYNG